MSEDIWARKPKKSGDMTCGCYHGELYDAEEMNAWLDELKAEYDRRDRVHSICQEYFGDLDSTHDSLLFEHFEEALEKSEKYDALVKTEPSEALLARMDGCREAEDKLEAVTKIVERWDSGDFPYQNDEYSDASQNASSLAMGHIQNKLLGDSDV